MKVKLPKIQILKRHINFNTSLYVRNFSRFQRSNIKWEQLWEQYIYVIAVAGILKIELENTVSLKRFDHMYSDFNYRFFPL